MASSDLTSLSSYTLTSFNPGNPPPPPPKPSNSVSTSQTPTNYPTTSGPPLPPPPPQTLSPAHTPPQNQQQHSNPTPPGLSEHWLPQILLDKTSQQLEPIFKDPDLLKALSQSHASLNPSPLPPNLQQTHALASHVSAQYQQLLALRQRTQSHLLHLHALERQWREKQSHMDAELAPWSAKYLYQRLKEAEREGEEWCAGLEGSWLDGEGEVGEREVGEFLRSFREGRGRVWRRREARERWDEGRVGGWR